MSDSDVSLQHLLVIDDNEAIHADFAKIFLRRERDEDLAALDAELFGEEASLESDMPEYELSFASQGCDGYDLLRQAAESGKRYGAAFVDMRMPPGWDGVETIEHLWQVDPDLQVVICTAFSDHSWDTIAERLGRTDKLLILKKPFDEIEVVQLATSLCEKRRLLDRDRKRIENLSNTVKTQESELESAHHSAEVLIDSISSILVSVDKNGAVVRWNPAAEMTFNLPVAEAAGKRFTELPIRWEDRSGLESLLQAGPENSDSVNEVRFVDQFDTVHSLEVRICRLGNKAVSGSLLIVCTDVTQQRFNQALMDQTQRLESVGQLAAGVANEINTPMQYLGDNLDYVNTKFDRLISYLQKVEGLISLADEAGFQPESVAELLQQAKKLKLHKVYHQIPEALDDSIVGVKHVSRIVQAMKELSHPGGESKSPVDLNHILETTITVSTNEWKYVADIDTRLSPDVGCISGLQGELTQVFLNLIVNASHAISDVTDSGANGKGLITVSTHRTNHAAVVEIADTGGGIPVAIQDRVFDPFFTTKQVGKGTGQGLAIAHSVVVQKHGGQLSFHVEEGVGTRFVIELPFEGVCVSDSIAAEPVSGAIR